MNQTSRTFRVFISSTFSDLKVERNAMQEYVYPRLRNLAAAYGCHFQAIDLRWGVSEEAALDQQTMKICLDEIKHCQKISPRPNFIILLGDRYGWRPLPYEIPVDEFLKLTPYFTRYDKVLIEKWYRRDDNAIPAVYCLQPREVEVDESANEEEKQFMQEQEARDWQVTENALRNILANAVDRTNWETDDPRRIKYQTSATEQEIIAGALQVDDAEKHVFGYFRTITNLEDIMQDYPKKENLPENIIKGKDFIDIDPDGKMDISANQKLSELKFTLTHKLPGNIYEYQESWNGSGISNDLIGTLPERLDQCLEINRSGKAPANLCEAVWLRLSHIILSEVKKIETVDALEKEIGVHENFGEERSRIFVGRETILKTIAGYIDGNDTHPLILWGESGCGKTVLMAKAIEQASENDQDVIYRFIGATAESSNERSLVESLCSQISRSFGVDETNIPSNYLELVKEFHKGLAMATKTNPIILFIDALNQLSESDHTHSLPWLPAKLPENVHLVVSTLPGKYFDALKNKLPEGNFLEIPPMSIGDGKNLLDCWLKEINRKLQNNQEKYVLDRFKICRLPLYFRLVFEEARLWKSYELFPMLSDDIPGILSDLFERLSQDVNHGEILLSRSLGYLNTARNGLSEDDLLMVLSADVAVYEWFLETAHHVPSQLVGFMAEYSETQAIPILSQMTAERRAEELLERMHTHRATLNSFVRWLLTDPKSPQLPIVLWSRLNSDLQPYLANCKVDGETLLNFYHQMFRKIACDELQSAESEQLYFHRQLADHFWNQVHEDWAMATASALRELPYQLICLSDWDRLEELFFTPGYVEAITQRVSVSVDRHSQNRYDGVLELIGDLKNAERILRADNGSERNGITRNFQALLEVLIDRIELIRQFPGVACQEIGNYLLDAGGLADFDILFREYSKGKLRLSAIRGVKTYKRTHGAAITALASPENGGWFIAGSADGTVGCWRIGQLEPDWFKQRHTSWITSAGISPNEKFAITGSDDGEVLLWNIETGESSPAPIPPAVGLFDALWYQVRFCAFADDESILVLRGALCLKIHVMSEVVVWSSAQAPPMPKRIPIRPHLCDYAFRSQFSISPSGEQKGASICDLTDGSVVRTIPISGSIVACALNSNGTLAAVVDAQGRMTFLDMNYEETNSTRFDRPLMALCGAGESVFFACDVDGRMFEINYALGRVENTPINQTSQLPVSSLPNTMRFLPSSNALIIGTQEGKLIALDVRTLATISEWGPKLNMVIGALSENGKFAVGITGNPVAGERIKGNGIVFVDEKGDLKTKKHTSHKEFITAAAVAPNGDYLSVDLSGRAVAWQFPDSFNIYDLDLGPLVSCQYWADGRQFVCASLDGAILLEDGTIHRSGDGILVTSLAVVGKPLLCVVGCADGSVRCYLDGGRNWNERLDKTGAIEVSKVTISQSGAWIAAGDINGTVSVWDTSGHLVLQKSRLHKSAISCILIDEMRGILFSAGYDRILIGTDLHSGKETFITNAAIHFLSLCLGEKESLVAFDAQGRILQYLG